MGSRVVSSAVAAVILAAAGWGQTSSAPAPSAPPSAPPATAPSTPTPSTPAPNSRTPLPSPTPTPQPPPSSTPQYPNQRPNLAERPVSGKVMMENGSAPPESVRVESVCGGRATILAYTDSRGGFSAATNTAQFSDARTPGPTTARRSMGLGMGGGTGSGTACVLRASLPGYRSTEINMAFLKDSFDPVTLILHPMGNVEGRTVSATSLAAPKDARAAFEKAGNAMRKRKWDDAQGFLEKAVKSYPRYAEAWSDLGRVYTAKNERDQARKAYQEAVAIDPKFIGPYFGLAELAMHDQKWQEMAEHTGTLLKLNAYDLPGAYAYDAMAHLNLNHLDEAEKSARQGIKIDDRREVPKNHHLLGVILMRKGDYQAAAEQLNKYLEAEPGGPDEEFVRRQIAACQARQAARGPAPAVTR